LPSARDEVEFGPLQRGAPAAAATELGLERARLVGLEELAAAAPTELSLGEQRRWRWPPC
jgi:NitT/TauT family transport system ATP-binding protein/taurine transport system ATP-binding protein